MFLKELPSLCIIIYRIYRLPSYIMHIPIQIEVINVSGKYYSFFVSTVLMGRWVHKSSIVLMILLSDYIIIDSSNSYYT